MHRCGCRTECVHTVPAAQLWEKSTACRSTIEAAHLCGYPPHIKELLLACLNTCPADRPTLDTFLDGIQRGMDEISGRL